MPSRGCGDHRPTQRSGSHDVQSRVVCRRGSEDEGDDRIRKHEPDLYRCDGGVVADAVRIEESRLRAKVYLHDGLDLDAAEAFWSRVLEIPLNQFSKPYRAVADPTRRTGKHANGCATVLYSCSLTHRRVMAMIEAITSSFAIPG